MIAQSKLMIIRVYYFLLYSVT